MSNPQVRIGPLEIRAERWPWQQGYNWHGIVDSWAPLNNGSRFGGGWAFKLGVSTGGWSKTGGGLMIDLLYGIVHINWVTTAGRKMNAEWDESRIQRRIDEAVKAKAEAHERASKQSYDAAEVRWHEQHDARVALHDALAKLVRAMDTESVSDRACLLVATRRTLGQYEEPPF